MKISNKILIFSFVTAVVLAVAAVVFIHSAGIGEGIAVIYLKGEVVEEIDLNAVTESYIIDVGDGNTVLVEPGRISMLSADCPDQLCVKRGAISDSLYPIVCLPNEVMILISGSTGSGQQPDAIAGR